MERKVFPYFLFCLISLVTFISLISLISLVSSSILVLDVTSAESGSRLFCSEVVSGDEILYISINSIFGDVVEERWQVQAEGKFRVVQVVSSPAVMGYYGIESYSRLDAERVSAIPKDVVYREIRMKVGTRGEQRLIVRGREVVLYQMVPEATTLTIGVSTNTQRINECVSQVRHYSFTLAPPARAGCSLKIR